MTTTFPTTLAGAELPQLPAITTRMIDAEMVTLCKTVETRLDADDLGMVASVARSVLVDETFESAFDAGLVRWASDGAIVPA